MRTCIILNPIAGGVKNIDAIQDRLRGLKAERLCISQRAGDAEKFASESSDFDLIVSAGGDGTLNEVVNGIAQGGCNAALGVLPLGTGNDFARTLGVPTDLETAIGQIMAGKTRAVDLVRVTSDRIRYFVNVSSGGFSGVVDEKLTPEMKRAWGPLAYLRSAAAAFSELRGYTAKVANGRYVAGGIPVAPEADVADGLLDIVLIAERGPGELAILAAQILLGKHLSSDGIIFRRAKKIAISSRPGMWFNVDGELIGNEPAIFELLPQALRCVVGAA
jgi:diacylglycerol kinase (ATP)